MEFDKWPYEEIFIYYIGQEVSYGVKHFYITFAKLNGYLEEDHDGSQYLTLVPIDVKNKEVLKKYEDKVYKIKYTIKLKK